MDEAVGGGGDASALQSPSGVVDVPGLLAGLAAAHAHLANAGVQLTHHADDGAAAIEADVRVLERILGVLLSTALGSTETGEVHVSASRIGEGRVAFLVADTGAGTTFGEPVRDLARALGGDVELTIAPGEGTTVSLVIPG